MSTPIRDRIIEQVDRLDEIQRQRLLAFARLLTAAEGTLGRDLLRFAGAIDRAGLEVMCRAIQEGCDAVNSNG